MGDCVGDPCGGVNVCVCGGELHVEVMDYNVCGGIIIHVGDDC